MPDRDAMDTFRALVQRDELSTRGLELTETLIRLNPGHYSIWCVRDIDGRADLVQGVSCEDSPRNGR